MTTTTAPAQTSHAHRAAMLRAVTLRGPDGRLEALLNEGSPHAPVAALVCHPHPKGGGSMHNKVVYHAMKAMNSPAWGLGWPVLRFNFRGTGLSEGVHDGRAETGDVLAAIEFLQQQYGLPVVVAGFSFGAAMALSACCGHPGVSAVAALGLPTEAEGRQYHYRFLSDCTLPKLLLSGDKDEYAPAAQLARIAALAAAPTPLVLLPHADHFFRGQLEQMQSALTAWLKEQVR